MRIELPEQGTVTRVVDAYELAPMQAGMLFHALSGEGPGVYVEQVVATLHEPLDADQLVRAWQRLLERHAVLRTRFRWQDVDAPLQEVLERAEIPVDRLDWRAFTEAEVSRHFSSLATEERERGFDLTQAPLMRLVLVRTAETEHRMLWTVHHALLDGHSRVLLFRELFVLYEAFMRGTEPQLAEPRPFRDYIAWLRTLDEAAAEAHWRAALAGFHARTPLLPARAHEREPAGASGRGVHEARLPLALTDALRLRARQARITLGMLVQAAWALLLHRYTGEPEVVFGVTRAGRPRALAGIGETLGIFINTLPVRIRIDPEAELVPWLGELRAQHAALRDHEHTPLAKVHDWSAVPRGTPLFESILVFDSHSLDTQLRSLGEAWRGRRFEVHGETNYPLTVAAYGDQELLLQIEYSRARFTDAATARMLGHLRTLLEAMAAPSPPRLKELPLLTAAERHQVLEAWNQTAVAYPAARCVHEMFEEQARLRPEALAVAGSGRSLTYRELDERAEALAGELRRRGVAPDTVVAIHLERSIEMLIAILAVWKAGGAYVPIDPLYPAERVRFMVEDTKAIAVLDKEGVRATWAPVRYPGSPHHLAYLIYTSGSSGQPKGVPIKHESLHNLICWHQRAYQVTSADRATLIAGPAFDASVWEVWPYLTAGASVHIPDDATRLDPGRLVAWLTEQRITLSFLPTPLAESVLRERWPETSTLRVLLTGGDKLNPPPAQALPFRLVNHYGPTENTVVSTCAEVRGNGVPPIGRPLPNTRAYVVDRHLQPVPVGVPGELLVGGAQLAAGYWNRPELTAAQFIQDPLGKPLYRTGDLVRRLPDGEIEFLGRIDHQVKIRGARVELGEIEATIARHPGVREVVVLARDDRLVAYVVGENDLRDFVRASLPEYMVPAAFIALDRLPLTPNGKVDRAALPAPAPADCAARGYEAPAGEVERTLARIWADVLKLERVGRHDHFFELGGHSLLAMQVVSRLRQALGVELPLQELFAAPVLSRLAPRIEALRTQPPPALAAPPIVAARSASGELSFSQQRMWFLDQLQPGTAAYVIPAAIEIRGRLDTPALERALAELVSRHESLRTVFLNVGGRPSQVVLEPWAWTLPLSDLSSEADPRARLAHHLREETRRAFDLASGPLFRARLYRLAADRHALLLAMHHIISDGWSMGILARELGDLYRHGPSSLPAPRIQYRDYARWQREWLHGDALQQLLAHWRARLAGAPQVLSLPTDRPRPAVESNRGALYSFTLPLELTEELRALARAEGATLYMTLLAGFALLLARYSGQRDFLVGTPVANRSRPELESVVGCFVNILVLRADLSGDPRASELIARLREVCLDAFAHQELPFDRLVEELQPARDLSRNPLFQVMFALYNAPERPFELPGLALSPLEVDPGAAKVDLALHLQETPQGLAGFFEYATDLFDEATIARMAAHWRLLLEGMSAAPQRRASELPLLTEAERRSAAEWNRTRMPVFPALACVHWQIEQQVERTPDQTALIFEEKEISYRELNARANRLAWRLIGLGIGPDRLVGIRLERSLDMVVAVLAVLKAGGAYVPLDPAFPEERMRFMIEDAGLAAVLTQSDFEDLPNHGGNPITTVTAANLAYVIYTSGSTGRPKGVMVEHRNVINFFAAMDACIPHDPPGTWLATTSLSFDISVLELLWTLARGFRVVIQGDVESYFTPNGLQDGPLGFSLFMWGNDDAPGRDKYRLMLEGAKYFDRNGFEAVWTPERHFHAFGGPYPNPSVTGAALAAVTERIAIRAGSCVAPLHHPIRIAEEWAVVDNLSNGRVALAFASGWQPNDFVLRPENHARNKAVMLEQIDQVRRLWRGEKVAFRNPAGQEVAVATLPRPVQPELPLWVTTAGNPETYRQAGELGANVLTHLLGQSLDEVAEKIAIYRQARAAAGHDPASGRVTLMLHTFVGADDDEVREVVRQPMKDYLRSSLKLMLGFAWTFPAFQRPGGGGAEKPDEVDVGRLSEAEIDAVLDFAFERYFEASGLFGSPSSCARMVERCKRAGVDEIACLLDFGVPTEQVLASLPYLNKVRSQANTKTERFSLAAQITRHGVTHLQCTPSLARMLLADGPTRAALAGIRQMLVGGEALPAALAREIAAAVGGELRNMYGPTETTVWSTTERVSGGADGVTIGRPIGNTQVYILDGFGQPLPAGVPGELAIGGAGVARGYLNQPELTELRFVDGLYRTGDVARFLPDGRIEYLGRADGQIKIRGYRVELGEIESLLGEHPGVGHAAVSVHESSLVAYVVGEADFTALRAHLRRQLPDYMVPGDFVRLSRMPFTPNGKLDRKALPAPERAAAAEFVAPGTPTEEALAEMWQRILRVERIGAKDNFFESGGHSLLAVHLVGGVRERFGIELPLKHLFERPTLSELAQAIDALAWMAKSKAPARSAGAREETVF